MAPSLLTSFTPLTLLAQATAESGGMFDARLIAPILAAVAIASIAGLIFSMVGNGNDRAKERLEKFSRTRSIATEKPTGTERLQDLLEKAAPALSKPLTSDNEKEVGELKARLMHAGYRSDKAVAIFNASRLICIFVGMILAAALVIPAKGFTQMGLAYSVGVVCVCFYIPTVFLSFRVKSRQEQIFFGLPDALDLMVVCVEAGLGLDAAMRKVCEEMNRTYPTIAEEFSICNFQLQMGRPRREVLHDLGTRTGVDDMKSLAAILIQADRFGSSIGQALRTQSDAMRVRRRQQAEERAAKTAVQLIIPLVMFIFPAIFIVLVGPAAIQIAENLVQ